MYTKVSQAKIRGDREIQTWALGKDEVGTSKAGRVRSVIEVEQEGAGGGRGGKCGK